MASGTIWMSQDGVLTGKIDWSSTSNGSAANTSTVYATMYARRTDGYTTYGSGWGGYLHIAGETVDVWFNSTQYVGSDWAWMASMSKTIQHNSDGTGSVYIEGAIQGCSGTSLASRRVFGNGSPTLDTIPRASEITSISADQMDGNITLNISVKNSAFRHELKWFIGDREYSRGITINNGKAVLDFTAQSLYYDVDNDNAPLWEADKKTISVKFRLTTFSGNTQIGSPYEKTVDVTLGNKYQPEIPAITIAQTELYENKFHAYIQNKSIISIDVDGTDTTKLNSTIDEYGFSYLCSSDSSDSQNLFDKGNKFLFTPKNAGKYYLIGSIKDSRGYTPLPDTTKYQSIDVIPYGDPVINTFSVERDDDNTKKVNIKLDCSVYSLGGKNDKRAVVKYTNLETGESKEEDVSEHFTIPTPEEMELLTNVGDNITDEEDNLLTGDVTPPYFVINKIFSLKDEDIDDDSQYDFEIQVYDFFNVKPITNSGHIGTAFQLMNFNVAGDGLAFGKVADNHLSHTIEIADNMTMLYHGEEIGTGGGGDTTPIGVIWPYPAAEPPSGWLICDGSAIDREIYKDLFAVIGTRYGSGNGTTTFNIPNFKGRVPVGYDSTQTEFNTLGKTGGEKTHVLSINEMPSHKHDDNCAVAAWGWRTGISGFRVGDGIDGYAWGSETSKGGNQAHNNLQPYIASNYIIKALNLVEKVETTSLDTIPMGSVIEYDGTEVPKGFEEVKETGELLRGYVLFSGSTTSNFSVSDSFANYEYVEIFYKSRYNNYSSVKVYKPNGKNAMLQVFRVFPQSGTCVAITSEASLNGTSVTLITGNDGYGEWWSYNNGITRAQNITVERVVGYK